MPNFANPRSTAPGPQPRTSRALDLLVVGDANPDLILHGGDIEPMFGQHERIVDHGALVLGGSGAITAVGAARLGLRTAMAAAVGDDVLGRFMLEKLATAGVDTTAVRVFDDVPTGISVALARPDDRAVLTARGALSAFDPAEVPDAVLRRTRHVHIASPFLQPRLLDGLEKLVARAHAAGATVSMDTGWDPEQRWNSVATAVGAVDVLLPNAQEAVRLAAAAHQPVGTSAPDRELPATDEPVAAAGVLAARGPLVAVKLGAEGAVAVHDGAVVRAAPYSMQTVDATGAGDSFDAGFLAGWLGGADIVSSLALGCACGALSTRHAGGTGGQPTREEADALITSMS
ncbi:carbohydrate kinase family protein [Micromonospora sp. NPDC049679]|uniref:carbohydrate kinase family protein n=1 Tax=Micromonospora sp. NPDC049679 TaxID=3155920 RepID=UPI0033F59771